MDEFFNPVSATEGMIVTCPDILGGHWDEAFHRYSNNSESGVILTDGDGVGYPINRTAAGAELGTFINWASAAVMTTSSILSPASQNHQTAAAAAAAAAESLLDPKSRQEMEEMRRLKYYSYGIALPAICILGIVGNVLNLIVLTRPSMKGPAYVYMRGYAIAALLAIVFALPFSSRILFHNEVGPWSSFAQAFFHAHLELFLGNACLGIGVFMLVALTVERYMAVCRLGRTRAFAAHKTPLVAAGLALLAVSLYVPYLFRAHVVTCHSSPSTAETFGVGVRTTSSTEEEHPGDSSSIVYRKQENPSFAHSPVWAVYLWTLEVIFKILPTLIVVHLNCCIIVAYRRTCARRRRMVTNNKTPSSTPAMASTSVLQQPSQLLAVPLPPHGDEHQPAKSGSRSSTPCAPMNQPDEPALEPDNLQLATASYGPSSSLAPAPTIVAKDGTVSFASCSNGSDRHEHCCCVISYNESVSLPTRSGSSNSHQSGQPSQPSEDSRRFWEEKRLMFLLGSTSILFSVCITPQLVLSLMIHEAVLESYSFQVFRAVANILEVTNYSFTFYIYCLFSRDFRATLLQTLGFTSSPSSSSSRTNGPAINQTTCNKKCSIALKATSSPAHIV